MDSPKNVLPADDGSCTSAVTRNPDAPPGNRLETTNSHKTSLDPLPLDATLAAPVVSKVRFGGGPSGTTSHDQRHRDGGLLWPAHPFGGPSLSGYLSGGMPLECLMKGAGTFPARRVSIRGVVNPSADPAAIDWPVVR